MQGQLAKRHGCTRRLLLVLLLGLLPDKSIGTPCADHDGSFESQRFQFLRKKLWNLNLLVISVIERPKKKKKRENKKGGGGR